MAERLIRYREASERLSIVPRTLRNWVKEGYFPKPLELGYHTKGWLESDFEQAVKNLHDRDKAG